jgi:hypothetical protein
MDETVHKVEVFVIENRSLTLDELAEKLARSVE